MMNTTYMWMNPGEYDIRFKPKDIHGYEGEWSVTLTRRLYLLGDTNGDDLINFDDVEPFVRALQGRYEYYEGGPHSYYETADMNFDGIVDLADISPFIELLMGGL